MSEQKKSSPWKWIGIGCGVIVLIGVCIFGACTLCAGGIWQATDAPAQAAHGFFADARAQNWQNAYQRMSPSYQSTHTAQTLQAAASQIPAITQQTDSTFTNRQVQNATANLDGHLTTPSGPAPVNVTLSNQGGVWYIDSITVSGMPLQ